MSNYTQTTNFATKDALASGNPLKIVKGTEINTEFANIATAVATKADTASPTFTGTVTIPTLATNPTFSAGTANGVAFLNGSNVLTTGSALSFDTSRLVVTANNGTTIGSSFQQTLSSGVSAQRAELKLTDAVNASALISFLPAVTSTSSVLTIRSAGSAVIESASGASAMTLDASGNLVVGGTSANLLAWNKAITLNTALGNAAYEVSIGGVAQAYLGADATNVYLAAYANKPLLVRTNNATVATFDTSGNFSFNSGYGSVAIAYGCRAWVNFNGTGTVAIRASGNVSSITDNGTGDYTINFTTAMSDANYSVAGSQGGGNNYFMRTLEDTTARTASIFRVVMLDVTANLADPPQANFSIFR